MDLGIQHKLGGTIGNDSQIDTITFSGLIEMNNVVEISDGFSCNEFNDDKNMSTNVGLEIM